MEELRKIFHALDLKRLHRTCKKQKMQCHKGQWAPTSIGSRKITRCQVSRPCMHKDCVLNPDCAKIYVRYLGFWKAQSRSYNKIFMSLWSCCQMRLVNLLNYLQIIIAHEHDSGGCQGTFRVLMAHDKFCCPCLGQDSVRHSTITRGRQSFSRKSLNQRFALHDGSLDQHLPETE